MLFRSVPGDFARHAAEIPGRIVLVRHEYPFSPVHVHRRRKIAMAMEHGAAGFIIANPWQGGGLLAGSSGRGGARGIPAVSTDFASALRLAPGPGGRPRVRLEVSGEDFAGTTDVLMLHLPGRGDETVCLSAHVDGHDLAESAMDNGSGVAVVLALARALAPQVAHCARGLRVCFFSAEEWALAGSKAWLAGLTDAARASIALNVNLDTVAGGARLTALTSEFPALDAFVTAAADGIGAPLGTYRPLMANSDHYN